MITFSRGLWTWPPWVICAPAFNHKVGNAAHSGVSKVLFFTKSYKWKTQRWKKWITGRLLLETMHFWGALIQNGWPTDPFTTEIKTSRCGLTISWLFSGISLQQFLRWMFRNMFNNNKYVFRAVGCFPGPYLAKRFYRITHKLKQYS